MLPAADIFSRTEWDALAEEACLSPRQKQISGLILHGFGDKQIAAQLAVTVPTIRTHMSRLFLKLGVQDRNDLLLYFFRQARRRCESVACPLRRQRRARSLSPSNHEAGRLTK
jgi:DNA-binding NarL/FixJ family response regulator